MFSVNTLPVCEEKSYDNTVISDDNDDAYCISRVDKKSFKQNLLFCKKVL